MRLVVHAGTHKTATTAFQEICHRNRDKLLRAGICYPEWEKRKNHGFLAFSLRQGDFGYIEKLFEGAVRRTRPDGTILISGEGLERCFVDVKMAFDLEDAAQRAGVTQVDWVVVQRKPYDYFQSLYAELSKQYLAMNYVEMAETILKHGFLSAACKYYDYMFVFDGRKFFGAFSSYRGARLDVLPFEQFTRPYPGHALFASILGRPELADSLKASEPEAANLRASPHEIETRYVYNFLGRATGIGPGDLDPVLLDALISARLQQISEAEEAIARRFEKRFGASLLTSLLDRTWRRQRGR